VTERNVETQHADVSVQKDLLSVSREEHSVMRHVMYNAGGERPSAPDEELACDAFARRFLLDGVTDYAARSRESAEGVLANRAAGIALGAYALYGFTPEAGRGGSADYPPVADRLDALFPEVSLPPNHWFWDFAASLLVATVVNHDRVAKIPAVAGRELCHALVQTVRKWHQA
jgi:hypothetical protein